MWTLPLHFLKVMSMLEGTCGLSCKIWASIITHIMVLYWRWLEMNLPCPRYKTVARMLYFSLLSDKQRISSGRH